MNAPKWKEPGDPNRKDQEIYGCFFGQERSIAYNLPEDGIPNQPEYKLLRFRTEGKALIVGALGQVGSHLCALYSEQPGTPRVLGTSREGGDGLLSLDLSALRSRENVERVLEGNDFNSVFCIGAMTDVDRCEEHKERAFQVNAAAPGFLAQFAWSRCMPFIYFSTEYVFAGRTDRPGPYQTDDQPDPINIYGQSKLAGERAVSESHPEALIIRTTVVYGPERRGNNYLHRVLRNLTEGKSMRVPEDQISTPTYNRDLVRIVDHLVRDGAGGVFHVCGTELLNRYQFALQIASSFDLNAELLTPVPTSASDRHAPRPLSAGLSTSKLRSMYPHLKTLTVAEALSKTRAEFENVLGPPR